MVQFYTKEERYQVSNWGLWRGSEQITDAAQLRGGDKVQMKVKFLNLMIDKECVLGIRAFSGEREISLMAKEVTIFPDVQWFDLVSAAMEIPTGETVDRVEVFLQNDFAWISEEEEFRFFIGRFVPGAKKAELNPSKEGFTVAVENLSEKPALYIGNYQPCKDLFKGTVCFVQDGKGLWILDNKYYAEERVIRENNTLQIPVSTVEKLFGKEYAQATMPGYVAIDVLAERLGAYCYVERFGLGVISELPYDYTETMYLKRVQFMVRVLSFQRPKAADLKRMFKQGQRPRSMGYAEEIQRSMQLAKTNKDAKFVSDELIKRADRFMQVPVQTKRDRGNEDACFESSIIDYDDILPLYWAWLMTEDEKYLIRFKEHALAVTRLDYWYGDRFYLMTSRALVTLALAYDFLYDEFTPGERKEMAQAMVEKGFLPAMELYYGRADEKCWPWCNRKTNWNFISNSGIIFAACTIFNEYETDICADVLEKAIQSLEFAMIYLSPNGELFEGPSYAAYSWNYLVFAFNALEAHFGTIFDLDHAAGAHLSYMVPFKQMSATGIYSQGDGIYCSLKLSSAYTMWWAKHMKDHGIHPQRFRQFTLGGLTPCFTDMLWFDDEAKEAEWPKDYVSESTQSAISRSDWSDTAAVIGIHAGDNTLEHGHSDMGTFDFEINGFRFAQEMGLDGALYCAPGSRYMEGDYHHYYTTRAEGHNVFVVNPDRSAGQLRIGKSTVDTMVCNDDQVQYRVDMEPAYRGQVKSATRYVGLKEKRRVFELEDIIEPMKAGDKIYWFWHTKAKISLPDLKAVEMKNEKHIVLTAGDRKVHLELECNIPYTLRKGVSLPLETSPAPFDQLQTEGIITKLLTVIFETGEETIHFKVTAREE